MFQFCKRVCCIAIMAPALTDATGQGKIKLSEPQIEFSNLHSLKGGRPFREERETHQVVCRDLNPKAYNQSVIDSLIPVSSSQNSKSKKRIIYKSSKDHNHFSKIASRNNSTAFQQEFIKSIGNLKRMNQHTSSNGDQLPEKSSESSLSYPASKNLIKNANSRSISGNEKSTSLLKNGTKNVDLPLLDIDKENNKHSRNGTCLLANDSKKMPSESAMPNQENSIENEHGNNSVAPTYLKGDSVVSSLTVKDPDKDSVNLNESGKCGPLTSNTCPLSNTVSERLSAVVENSSVWDTRLKASVTQVQLDKRLEFNLRRIRRLQGKDIEKHVRNQISLCLEHQQKNLHSLTKSISTGDISKLETNQEFNVNVLNKNLSTAALVNLVQQAQKQALNTNSSDHLSANTRFKEMTYLVNMDKRSRRECQKVSDLFSMNLNHVNTAMDSDATESSSGGDSDDDIGSLPHNRKLHRPLNRQAEWKWSAERAAMASRWTWLQAQVSDLEYRIRQHSDIYKQIRQSKGSIVLGDPQSPPNLATLLNKLPPTNHSVTQASSTNDKTVNSPCYVSKVLSNLDKQANKLTQSLGNVLTPSVSAQNSTTTSPSSLVNGLEESPTNSDTQNLKSERNNSLSFSPVVMNDDTSCQAARCRPLCSYRKRKLLWNSNVNQSSRAASRLSSIDCMCYPPVTPCTMCGGRSDNKQPTDADTMPYNELVSHLDSSYHPVLSFPSDTPLYLKFVSLLKTGDWINKQKALYHDKNNKKRKTNNFGDNNRKKIRKSIAAAIIQSAKIRNKYESKKRSVALRRKIKKNINSDLKRKRKLAIASLKRRACRESDETVSLMKELRADYLKKKRGESAYDINNIVIPYSIAASTRVEKLQYKEIATPEWRDISNEPVVDDSNDSEREDLSDEAILIRHQKCEAEEKKRFASFIQYPVRRRFKTDSLDSIGSKLTDPTSSHPEEFQISPALDDSLSPAHRLSFSTSHRPSISKREHLLSTGSSFDDTRDVEMREIVEPWIARSFPITEEEYADMTSVEQHVPEKKIYTASASASVSYPNSNSSRRESLSSAVSSHPSSPSTVSTISNSLMEEEIEDEVEEYMDDEDATDDDDPNDPEWKGTSKEEVVD